MENFKLTSSDFLDGQEIPKKHGYKFENINPSLSISNVPSNTQSLVLIMDDPDAKAAVGKEWVHWVLWDIEPGTTEIPQGNVPSNSIQGSTDFGEKKYGGPAPPDKIHTYIFKLYALDTKLNLEEGASKKQVEEVMDKHVIEKTVLTGTFAP